MEQVVPEDIVEFLERATVGIGGTRDRALVPYVHRVSGWSVGEDRRAITCLVAEPFAELLLPSLEDNGQFALTVSEVPSHETYQLKGNYLRSRAVDEEDVRRCDRQRERFVQRVSEVFGFDADPLRAYVPPPGVAFEFAVREIFLQTPGPHAGQRIVPPDA